MSLLYAITAQNIRRFNEPTILMLNGYALTFDGDALTLNL